MIRKNTVTCRLVAQVTSKLRVNLYDKNSGDISYKKLSCFDKVHLDCIIYNLTKNPFNLYETSDLMSHTPGGAACRPSARRPVS